MWLLIGESRDWRLRPACISRTSQLREPRPTADFASTGGHSSWSSQIETRPFVLTGSWGRHEITSESDDDFMVMFEVSPREGARPSVDEVARVLGGPPTGP